MKTPAIATLTLIILAPATAQAEISGSGSPRAGCTANLSGQLWHDLNGDAVPDAGEPGLPGISLQLYYDDLDSRSLTANTDASGRYMFESLCDGDYLVVIDEDSVPDGLIGTTDEADEDLGGWTIEIDDDGQNATFDLGYTGCPLSVQSSCRVASLASELYSCEKPVHQLSVTWAGEQDIRVVAHRGNRDADVLADIDNVSQGQTITVAGLEGAGKDSTWEIFAAGTDHKLGESKFHLECDDIEMDGPEDCGLPQGDGKDNKADRINDWRLEGIVDDSGLLQCTQSARADGACRFQGQWADCELLDKVNYLTLVYTGGGCGASYHNQPAKFQCAGGIAASEPVTVTLESGESFLVEPGDAFTIPKDGSDTDIELSNTQGTETMRIHTSCSEPLAAGDIFGSLTLAAINGLGIGAHVDFEYVLHNKSSLPVTAIAREAPRRTLFQPSHTVAPASTTTVAGSAWIMASTDSALVARPAAPSGPACGGGDYVGVVVTPPAPCEISGFELHFHDKEIRWNLSNSSGVLAAIDRVELSWPGEVTDKLKEMKLDGDKFFDQDRVGSSAAIVRGDLEGDYHKRFVRPGETRQLKIIFDDDVDTARLEDFQVRVEFAQGCSLEWMTGEAL